MSNQKGTFTQDKNEERCDSNTSVDYTDATGVDYTDATGVDYTDATDGNDNVLTQKSKILPTLQEPTTMTVTDGTPPPLTSVGLQVQELKNQNRPPAPVVRRSVRTQSRKRGREVDPELPSPEQRKIRRLERRPSVVKTEYITLIPPKRRNDVKATLSDVYGPKYTILRGDHRLLCVEKGNEHYIVNHDGTLTPYKRKAGDTSRKSLPYDETYSEYSTSLAALKELDLVGYMKTDGDFQVAVSTRNGIRYISETGELYKPDGQFKLIDTKAKLFDMIKNLSNREKVLKRILKNWEAYNKRKGNAITPLFKI